MGEGDEKDGYNMRDCAQLGFMMGGRRRCCCAFSISDCVDSRSISS